ncbi:MAG: saccharopine dehydrogenase NADP-binding domain-containing protein [Pseudomonadales bacterium]|nr:saccharopine dehydrogenase NADP-binding domain-containing protein [Pseudomonadales bacterium]
MFKVVIIGAGKIGSCIAKLLQLCGDYQLLVIDQQQAPLKRLHRDYKIPIKQLESYNSRQLAKIIKPYSAVISACAFHENIPIAEAALAAGISYFDLTEDIQTCEAIKKLALNSQDGQIFVPQCGLAPGFISILAHHICQGFDDIDTVKLRVGALPEFPSNLMMYNLTWSTEGLINEYCNPCHGIRKKQLVNFEPLEGLENFSLDGAEYEAFNTSGGLGTLCDSLKGRVQNLDYKTIRYKGHQYLMDFLINGLKLGERRSLLKKIFENAVAMTKQDVVIILVSATGHINGQLMQVSDSRKIYNRNVYNEHWGAIQISTAAGICAVLDLFFEKQLSNKGFNTQESIAFSDFINNRFGQYYQTHNRGSHAPRYSAADQP